jgi:glutamyl-tRNA synthetase
MLLRIEDLDGPRARFEMVEAALRDLAWLGLDWDGALHVQSAGLIRLNRAVDLLVERGLAYPCTCSRSDVRSAQSAPQLGDVEVRYPGTCRGRYASLEEARSTGRPVGLRFHVPAGAVPIEDSFAGAQSFDVQADVGDFLVARRDAAPAYQLAVVVDDAEQGVTEVLRGDDLLPSAARQWHLQCALALRHPVWAHVPLVTDAHGRRLAKRSGDLSLAELRANGTDPRAIVAWAAASAGVAVSERITPAEAVGDFALERMPREPVRLTAAIIARLRASHV